LKIIVKEAYFITLPIEATLSEIGLIIVTALFALFVGILEIIREVERYFYPLKR
jgi:hypothetical protein